MSYIEIAPLNLAAKGYKRLFGWVLVVITAY